MDGIVIAIYRFFAQRRWLLALLVAMLLGGVGAGVVQLRFSEDITDLLPSGKAGSGANIAFDASAFTDRVIFHVYADSAADALDLHRAADALVDSLAQLQPNLLAPGPIKIADPDIDAIYSAVLEQLPYLMNDGDFDYLQSIINRDSALALAQQNYRNIVAPTGILSAKYIVQDPLGLGARVLQRLDRFNLDRNLQLESGFLTTGDGRHVLLFVQPAFRANDSQRNAELKAHIDRIRLALEEASAGQFEVEAFGAPLAAAVNAAQIKEDIYLTVSLALATLLIVIYIFYRSLRVFLFILLPSLVGGAVALGLFALVGVPVSLIALSIGSILLGISIDYALHVFTHFRSKGDVEGTLNDLVQPVLLSATTTAAAFFTLTLLGAPAMTQLGLFAGTSVLMGAVAALVILPHVLTQKMQLPERLRNSFIDRINQWRPDKSKWVVGLVTVGSVVFFFFSDDAQFEGDLLKLNYSTPELQRAEANLEAVSNAALKQVMMVAHGGDWSTALNASDTLYHWLRGLGSDEKIAHFASVSHVLPTPEIAQARLVRWSTFVRSGQLDSLQKWTSAAAEQQGMREDAYGGFFQRSSGPIGAMDYERWGTLPLFENFIRSDSGNVQLLTAVRMEQTHRRSVTAQAGQFEHVAVLDKQYLTNQIIDTVQRQFDKLVSLSLLVVFLLLFAVYGRVELALYTFIPMLIAWIWTLALMSFFDLKFNIFNIIVSTFVFGLGIDYSIFISRSMIQQYKYGRDALPAYKNSIFLSAFTTSVGIGVLILAEHPALRSVAAMSLVGIGSMVLITYTLQPLLYRITMIDRKAKGQVPVTWMNLSLGLFSMIYFFVGCLLLNVYIVLLQLVPVSQRRKRAAFRRAMGAFLGSLAAIMANVRRDYLNPHNETFETPAVIIANHQSFIDILTTLNMHPKMVMVVKKWVYDSPLFGWAVKYAGHFHVNEGYEQALPHLRDMVSQGCSIVVFPEGTRSVDGRLNRFHKGAFFLSEQLELDIVPLILHGNHYSMTKGDSLILKNGHLHRIIMERIPYRDRAYGESYRERTKTISKLFKARFAQARRDYETPRYFRNQLMLNYILKGPVLEWYTRIKTRLEDDFTVYEALVPKRGTVVDIGCGYGYLSHILAWTSADRRVIGIDHDAEKINVAQQTPTRTPNLAFEVRDLRTAEVPEADAYVMIDVLHYFTEKDQRAILLKCLGRLRPGGLLLVRDADAGLSDRHRRTWWTEFFSTRLGFNKTNANPLCFVSRDFILATAKEAGAQVEVIDNTSFTSNILFKITL